MIEPETIEGIFRTLDLYGDFDRFKNVIYTFVRRSQSSC